MEMQAEHQYCPALFLP